MRPTTSGGACASRASARCSRTGLNRFKIRVKVEIEDRSADRGRARGARRRRDRAARRRCSTPAGSIAVRVDWPDVARRRDRSVQPAAIDARRGRARRSAGAAEIDADAYEAMRIEAGVPRQGFDIDETTIPQEAFLERDAVSFTKGCFLGQELVCRIDTRGHVNRLLRRLRRRRAARARRGGRRRRQGGRHGHERGRRRRARR